MPNYFVSDFEYSCRNIHELKIPDFSLERDGEIPNVSYYAQFLAFTLLEHLHEQLGSYFPYCSATLESQGGIDLVWDNTELNKRVWVTIPHSSNLQCSVLYSQNDVSKFISPISVELIYNLLVWLLDKSSEYDLKE